MNQEIEDILKERGSNYGEFNTHAGLTQSLKWETRKHKGWNKLTDSQKEAIEMVFHKFGRIINGNPSYLDSWTDCIGYLQLVIKELKEQIK